MNMKEMGEKKRFFSLKFGAEVIFPDLSVEFTPVKKLG